MIQGYIEDGALFKESTSLLVNENVINQGAGYFSSSIKNYYTSPICVMDKRTSRLSIFAQPLKDRMKLWFDGEHIVSEEPANNLSSEQWNYIFNIIEYVIYTSNTEVINLETYMIAHPELFGTFNPNSLSVSDNETDVTCNLSNDTEVSASIRRYLRFQYLNNTATVDIRLWIDSSIFANDYPLYKITRVVPPCSPNTFLTVGTGSTISTIITAANYELPIMDNEITTNDHSGIIVYKTKFVNENIASTYDIPFTIFYKGHEPGSIAIRIAIRQFLESVSGIDPSVWPTIFPDLYTDTRMYIIPVWNNTYTLPTGIIYPSITLNKTIEEVVKDVFPGLQPDYITNNTCTLTCDASSVNLIAIPDPDNTTILTLLQLHPTYRDMDATNSLWNSQATETRDFNLKLCNAIANILGSVGTITSFITIEEDGKLWLTFISNLIEYCVLTKESFPV